MAFAFPTESSGDPWWSVRMVNPLDAVPVTVPYIRLRETTSQTGYPLRIFKLLQRSEIEKIGLTEWIARLTNVCMIEAGFIPIFHDEPAIPVDEWMQLSDNDIMIRCIDTLDKILEEKKLLNVVKYTYIMGKDQNSNDPDAPSTSGAVTEPQPSSDKLSYSLDQVTLTVFNDDDRIMAIGQNTKGMHKVLDVDCFEFMENVEDFQKNRYHSLQYIYYGKFDAMQFVDTIKVEFVYLLLDVLDGENTEVRGFANLPAEMLKKLAEYMDLRTFVKFLATSRRLRDILDSDDVWKIMFGRLLADLRLYGLPTDENVLAGSASLTLFRDKCLFVYQQAKLRRQRLLDADPWSRVLLGVDHWHPFRRN